MLRKIALPTLHGKGDQIIPEFRKVLPFDIFEVAIDTDTFGTFSGEIERTLPPRDAAIAKAEAAILESGWDGAIASEGSIGADPLIPLLTSDREVMVFIDRFEGVTITESVRSFDIIAKRFEYRVENRKGGNLDHFLKEADFPNHRLIVSTRIASQLSAIKGIDERHALEEALVEMARRSDDGVVAIESDLRAHCSPSRQRNIAKAAKALAERVARRCPGCDCPGWGTIEHIFGVECSACGHIDRRIAKRAIYGCLRCEVREEGDLLRETIDPGECELCNP